MYKKIISIFLIGILIMEILLLSSCSASSTTGTEEGEKRTLNISTTNTIVTIITPTITILPSEDQEDNQHSNVGPVIHASISELPNDEYIIYESKTCEVSALSIDKRNSICLVSGIKGLGSMSSDGQWLFMCALTSPMGAPQNPTIIRLDNHPEIITLNDRTLCPDRVVWTSDSRNIALLGGIDIRLVQIPSGITISDTKLFNYVNDVNSKEFRNIEFGVWSPNNEWIAYRMSQPYKDFFSPYNGSIYILSTSCLLDDNCSNKSILVNQIDQNDIYTWTKKNELAILNTEEGIMRFYNVSDGSVIRVLYNLPFTHPEKMVFSPDDEWIMVLENSKLFLMPSKGGEISSYLENIDYIYEWLVINK